VIGLAGYFRQAPFTPALPASGERVRAGVVLLVDAALGHAAVQHVEPLLAPAAAGDLGDPRRQHGWPEAHAPTRSVLGV